MGWKVEKGRAYWVDFLSNEYLFLRLEGAEHILSPNSGLTLTCHLLVSVFAAFFVQLHNYINNNFKIFPWLCSLFPFPHWSSLVHSFPNSNLYKSLFLFFVSMRVWTQGLILALLLEQPRQPFFVLGIFEIGSRELFTLAGLEPDPSDLHPLGS
jgi:hypothetical protein